MFKRKEIHPQTKSPRHQPSLPSTSVDPEIVSPDGKESDRPSKVPWRKRCFKYLYDKDRKLFCGRTCKSWMYITVYSIMYLIFLSTYMMIFLFCSLLIIKNGNYLDMNTKIDLYTYSKNGIGLSVSPTSLNNQPLIWYRNDEKSYQKYINSLEGLFSRRQKREINNTLLGPCAIYPYGYGLKPCVVIRINKQLHWSVKPISSNSSENLPNDVRKWMKLDEQKLWLYCKGYHKYDREHIKTIMYYPDPPGFDPGLFPIDMKGDSQLIAVQFAEFTLGVSLAIQCSVWYEGGVSTTEFVLYVTPKRRNISK